jgi:hypothetical protein
LVGADRSGGSRRAVLMSSRLDAFCDAEGRGYGQRQKLKSCGTKQGGKAFDCA